MFTLINLRITIVYHDRGRNIAHRALRRTFMQRDSAARYTKKMHSVHGHRFLKHKVGPVTKSDHFTLTICKSLSAIVLDRTGRLTVTK